jgi:hypothetical protein
MGRLRQVSWNTVAVLVIGALGAAACDESGTSSRLVAQPKIVTAHGTEVVAEGLRGPGTPLDNGFSVPEGAAVVGASFPSSRDTGYDDLEAKVAWAAVLLVRGRNADVGAELLRQAARQGMTIVLPFQASVCNAVDLCVTTAQSPEQERLAVPWRSLRIELSPSSSLMKLSYQDFDPSRRDPPGAVNGSVNLPPQPLPAAKLLEVGDPLAPDLRVRVQPGSEPLTGHFCDRCWGSDVLVMHAPGGKATFDAYVRAARARTFWESEGGGTETRDGWRIRSHGFGHGHGGLGFALFQRPGEVDYLLVSVSSGP